jgi:hypothetical protein
LRPFEAGDVLRGPIQLGNSRKERPFIVVADEDPEDGTLVVCTTTDVSYIADQTTRLTAGCHPYINKDCTVAYGEAKVLDASTVENLRAAVQDGIHAFKPNVKLSAADLQRVQKGFGDSNGIPLDQRDLKINAHEYAKKRSII